MRFQRAHKAELQFGRHLRQVARQVGVIVNGLAPKGRVGNLPALTQALRKYSDLLTPWAEAVSRRMIEEVGQRDEWAWMQASREIGQELRREIRTAPTGALMQQIVQQQVALITSLPIQAAERVHKLTIEAMVGGTRAEETAAEIMKTGKVTESRAMLIARTETTRTATAMTEARAVHIGSEGYFWRTSGDADVRPEHRKLNGKFIRWSDPPVAGSNGERAHAGSIYNCRCYPEPVIPDQV